MLPHIAAGNNLNLPVAGPLLRRGGAFFMRRKFAGDALYTAVFESYVDHLFTHGFAMEYFVEGGRSRSGRMLSARWGMLRMTLGAHNRGLRRPLAFVPVHFSYERIIEGGELFEGASRRRKGTRKPPGPAALRAPVPAPALWGRHRHLRRASAPPGLSSAAPNRRPGR